jgi:polysaccharide chain length determinant protein (PEP-CTERM system associated)
MTHDEPGPSLDYAALPKRRRWSLIVPTVLGLLVGVGLIRTLPREYVATATLAVTSPTLSGGLTPGQSGPVERIRAISHELLSEPVVQQVARDEHLVDSASLEEAVLEIRNRTSVSLPPRQISAQSGREEPDTFLVSYTGRSPDLAQRVANRLTQVFVEQHTRMRETRAEDTSAFLERQLGLSREKLDAAETKLREAKASFQGRLPEQAMANMQAVAELRQRLETDTQALATERERITVLGQQIEGLRQDAAAAAAAASESRTQERLGPLEQQLAEARQQFTPRHPEVQRLEAELARARAEDASAGASNAPAPLTDPNLRTLMADREGARLRVQELEAAVKRTQAELTRYQGLLNEVPIVEQRLMSLSQAYDFEKQQHQRLNEQYQQALLNEDLERRQAGERFVVLYAAQRPGRPSSPNLLLVLAASIIGGLALGVAWAVLRELLDRSVHDRRTLEAEYGRPILAEIPHF